MKTSAPMLEWITVRLRGSRWALTASALALWATLAYAPGRQPFVAPTPNPARPPEIPAQEHTADVAVPLVIGRTILSTLPAPDTRRQRKPPCAESVGEEAINGYCWLRLGVKPPCDNGNFAFEYKGACYMAGLNATKLPTSGGGQLPGGVSSPPEASSSP